MVNDDIKKASKIIRNGGIVLFPTETVYGIGANAFDDEAVKKVFIAKGRAQDNPLILHISDMDMLNDIAVNITDLEYRLMDAFWPGPFTIILNKRKDIASAAACNGNTVGVRMPSNKIAHIKDIIGELKNRVDYVIDGGETDIGLESTVVRVIDNEVKILRPGKITKEDIENVISKVIIDKNVLEEISSDEKVLSPGMKYKHYAPMTKSKLIYSDDNDKVINTILEIASKEENVVILSFTEDLKYYDKYKCLDIGSRDNLDEVSHKLFSVLRKIDNMDVDLAIIEGLPLKGLGLAIMNRLIRACNHDYLVI